jgi:nucleotide-binding universal stress UspA family protein
LFQYVGSAFSVLDHHNAAEAIAKAADVLDVDAVLIGATKRSAFYHMLRGHVVKGLMKRLPRDCHLIICN